MADERSTAGLRKRLDKLKKNYPKAEAVELITEILRDEYRRIEGIMRDTRDDFLNMDADIPANQNDVADLRLEAAEEYQPAYIIENFLAEMGVDVTKLVLPHKGLFEVSSHQNGEWSMSMVSLKESAMRTLGGHCNVIGDIVVLEKLLYDHTYLAAVMKQTDDYVPGEPSYVEFDFYTVVFDEDIQAIDHSAAGHPGLGFNVYIVALYFYLIHREWIIRYRQRFSRGHVELGAVLGAGDDAAFHGAVR